MTYTWLPLYKELAHWILAYRNKQNELCDILRAIEFKGNLEDEDSTGKRIPLMEMDRFTFFAFFMKIKNLSNRSEYFKKLKERVGLKSEIPKDFNGVPSAQPMLLWYFKFKSNRPPEVMENLWDLAEQTVVGKLDAETFQNVYDRPLFWLNPEQFYPIDAHKNYLEEKGINTEVEKMLMLNFIG
jgi:5-methylcytosine-specific restriction protein B